MRHIPCSIWTIITQTYIDKLGSISRRACTGTPLGSPMEDRLSTGLCNLPPESERFHNYIISQLHYQNYYTTYRPSKHKKVMH